MSAHTYVVEPEAILIAGGLCGLVVGTYIASVDHNKAHYIFGGAIIGVSFPISIPVLAAAAIFNFATEKI